MLAIDVQNVHKTFRIPHENHTTLTERVLSLFRPVSYERFEALRGVDLAIERGSFIGIIGGNGSGKSTLLKIISGLLLPDTGHVQVNGTMSALLELGLGFSPELTVQENVELYAAVLGYPRREVARRVDEAIAFAGLERFRDAKLKNLSTGMRARLGFSTALQAESDIMLLDEILAVGDADFQLKCLDVFEEFKQQRRTMVLVTHDLSQVQRFCDEAVLIAEGRVAVRGDPDTVITQYLRTVGQLPVALPELDAQQRRNGSGHMRARRAWVEDEAGRTIGRVRAGDRAVIVVRYEVMEDVEEPILGFAMKSEDGTLVWSVNTHWDGTRTQDMRAGQIVEMRVPFLAALANGRYSVQAGAGNRHVTLFYDVLEFATTFVVHGSPARYSIADLMGRVTYRMVEDDEDAAPHPAPEHKLRGGTR